MLTAITATLIGAAMYSQAATTAYTVHRTDALPAVSDSWDAPEWAAADTLTIERFHPRGSGHRPLTQARVLHDGNAIAVMFRVSDRYVIAKHVAFQSPTHLDSCVEFFVKPNPAAGYFNFEFNAIGTLLLWYVEKPRGPDGQFEKYTEIPRSLAKAIPVHTSLTKAIQQESPDPIVWTVSFRIPKELFEAFVGAIEDLSGQEWTGNFYKCADASSHPHWGYWADVGEKLDFHQPSIFGKIVFE